MDTKHHIEHLLSRHLQGLTTDEENQFIAKWAAQTPENRAVLDRLESKDLLREDLSTLFQLVDTAEGEARLQRMKTHIRQHIKTGRKTYLYSTIWLACKRYAAAAVVLVVLALGAYYYQRRQTVDTKPRSQHFTTVIRPGGNRATLTLADGHTVNLSEAHSGIVVGNGILYSDGSTVLDEQADILKSETISQLKLSTPKGGTYQLTLPDGTKVWLNAATTLKYPSRFSDKARIVELEGEAYFEVKPVRKAGNSPNMPFLVISRGQQVEVLGTQFNISAYPDERSTKTTLVEGSVRIASSAGLQSPAVIRPGEQAATHGSAIDIVPVDTDQYIAWKDGRFHFRRTPLEEVMRQVSRWYDVDVVYKRGIPKESFTGKVSRNASLTELLDILQLSAIPVKLEDNQLIVD